MKEIPSVLYKYRDWNDPYHKRCITDTEIYFASASEFNDPFDCAMPFRYKEVELTEENIFRKLIEMGRKAHPDWDATRLHDLAYNKQKEGAIQDEYHFQKHDEATVESFNSKFGIVCLSTNKNNILMWSHYARSHNGFSIGYDSRRLIAVTGGQLGPIQYEMEFPKFDLFGGHVEYFIKRAYVKSVIWEYEDEYRLVRERGMSKIAKLTKDCIVEIVLGCRMHQPVKFEMLKIIAGKYPDVKVFDTRLNGSKFELVLDRVR